MEREIKRIIKELKAIEKEVLQLYKETDNYYFYFACLGILQATLELRKALKGVKNAYQSSNQTKKTDKV